MMKSPRNQPTNCGEARRGVDITQCRFIANLYAGAYVELYKYLVGLRTHFPCVICISVGDLCRVFVLISCRVIGGPPNQLVAGLRFVFLHVHRVHRGRLESIFWIVALRPGLRGDTVPSQVVVLRFVTCLACHRPRTLPGGAVCTLGTRSNAGNAIRVVNSATVTA